MNLRMIGRTMIVVSLPSVEVLGRESLPEKSGFASPEFFESAGRIVAVQPDAGPS